MAKVYPMASIHAYDVDENYVSQLELDISYRNEISHHHHDKFDDYRIILHHGEC
jgi:hypothetical protein